MKNLDKIKYIYEVRWDDNQRKIFKYKVSHFSKYIHEHRVQLSFLTSVDVDIVACCTIGHTYVEIPFETYFSGDTPTEYCLGLQAVSLKPPYFFTKREAKKYIKDEIKRQERVSRLDDVADIKII